MRVLVAGATGVLGKRLIPLLTQRGHEVIGLARDERGEQIVADAGGQPSRASLFDTDALTEVADGCEAIIHVATAIPKKQKPTSEDWAINDRIRIEGTRTLTDVTTRVGARQFIFQSVAWVARPDDQSPFDEESPANPNPVTQSAADAEHIALEASEQHGFTTTILRGGWFYAPDTWHIRTFGDMLRKRMLPVIGSGEAFWSILHVDDAASAFATAVEHRPAGIYHVTDSHPVPVGEFFGYFAERLGAKPPRRMPAWLVRLVGGETSVEFLTTSTITTADRFCKATGWTPQYPDYKAGIDQIVRTWEAEGRR